MIASRHRWPPRAWTGCAAAARALAFAGLSFYWAAGGRLGLGTLALALRDKTLAREQGFVALLWFTGALKVLVALLAFALVRRRGTVLPRRVLLGAGWATGVALALYGALGLINGGLAQVGAVQPADANAARWYFVLWGPIWLLGGLLMLATVRRQIRLGHGKATTSARLFEGILHEGAVHAAPARTPCSWKMPWNRSVFARRVRSPR